MGAGPDARRYLGATPPECCTVFFPFICFMKLATVMFAALGNGVFFSFYFITALTAPRAAGRVIIRARLLPREDALERENSSDEPLRFDSSHLLSHVEPATCRDRVHVMSRASCLHSNLQSHGSGSEVGACT